MTNYIVKYSLTLTVCCSVQGHWAVARLSSPFVRQITNRLLQMPLVMRWMRLMRSRYSNFGRTAAAAMHYNPLLRHATRLRILGRQNEVRRLTPKSLAPMASPNFWNPYTCRNGLT